MLFPPGVLIVLADKWMSLVSDERIKKKTFFTMHVNFKVLVWSFLLLYTVEYYLGQFDFQLQKKKKSCSYNCHVPANWALLKKKHNHVFLYTHPQRKVWDIEHMTLFCFDVEISIRPTVFPLCWSIENSMCLQGYRSCPHVLKGSVTCGIAICTFTTRFSQKSVQCGQTEHSCRRSAFKFLFFILP